MNLSWDNIHFSVKKKKILTELSGNIHENELTAIMGPSGSGKTTLLNILSGRCTTGKISGEVQINNNTLSARARKKLIAYVMQDDYLLETQTPREAIRFSAEMRLPSYVDKIEQVNETIDSLQLTNCADIIIGSISKKGISGG